MSLTAYPETSTAPHRVQKLRNTRALAILGGLWAVLFFASLFSPPILDDADATHANAARQMLLSGDWVTLRINNVRYLEKAPLPYWLDAISFHIFGFNTFAAHLPQVLGVLLLALLGLRWSRQAFGQRAALYTGVAVLTSAGVFLFTRVFIPDSLLSLFLAAGLYCFLQSMQPTPLQTPVISTEAQRSGETPALVSSTSTRTLYPYGMWIALALAVLTKGLVAIVFLFGVAGIYLALTGELHLWRRLKPLTGAVLFLAIAAPWHILAGLRNTGGYRGHGFFWFYFINEHVLRFLGRRIPRDYNKLPGYLYWSLHLVWLFPWTIFLPVVATRAFLKSTIPARSIPLFKKLFAVFLLVAVYTFFGKPAGFILDVLLCALYVAVLFRDRSRGLCRYKTKTHPPITLTQRTTLLLLTLSCFVLAFFSLSTNQEYYTFPAYLPLLMLLCASLAYAESIYSADPSIRRRFTVSHATFTVLGLAISAALAYGLWTARHLPFVPDIGDLLAHRGVGHYTLSMSSLFDLTGRSFAALRLPAILALAAFTLGPAIAWMLRRRRLHLASTFAVALTSAVFLIAAHIAFARFAPMLSSQDMAAKIKQLEASGAISRDNTFLLYGDQAYGSSIPFYLDRPLHRPALLVDGRTSSMWFGSTFPDAQGLFLTPQQLLATWGKGQRKLLFVPLEHRDDVDQLLGPRQIILKETSGKALITDRPLNPTH